MYSFLSTAHRIYNFIRQQLMLQSWGTGQPYKMSTPSRSIKKQPSRHSLIARSPFSTSFLSTSPIAQESIARDLLECSDDENQEADHGDSDSSSGSSTVRADDSQHSIAHAFRRPSAVAYGAARPALTPQNLETVRLSKREKKQSRNEERSLLRDNNLYPPKHSEADRGILGRLYKSIFSTKHPKHEEETGEDAQLFAADPSETSLLVPDAPRESRRTKNERLNRQWEEAVAAGQIQTTWQRETKTLWNYASPLVVTFILQYSLTVASIFTVGHIGSVELGAVSLASMTANITGYAIYQGLATSLDTLCSQAYGSGRKELVGLQMQRMVYFLWILTIPIGLVWFFAEDILIIIIPERRSAELAGLYLRILLAGAPGFAAFESGKRFVQAQGLFSATTYVLLVAAPLNAFMNWLFVWHFGWGFVGAPIAVVITDNLLPLLLLLYVWLIEGRECWNGFTTKAFRNWIPMIKLALPGLIMVEAEFLAFEVLILAASYLSTTHLAAQSILSTVSSLTFQIPFSVSIAGSTRVANLIGATLSDAAKTSGEVTVIIEFGIGIFNVILLSTLRTYIPHLFTDDVAVVTLVAKVLPVCAMMQLFDALAAGMNGLLRGLGRQEVGGYTNLFCYYVVAMPISFGTTFGLDWGLAGLWIGPAIALMLVAMIEGIFLYKADWEEAVDEAQDRNAAA
ncbi:MATE transporter [Calycina marina]|uniref:MATE transporter n=1 Tax=Calycina marina TaxID=1763456 RepID=A0A9P7ZAV5_9HELO|nr:MATE transporter [Calycina marina]